MSAVFNSLSWPFKRSFRTLQYYAHEYPAYFYSTALGAAGPVLVMTVPNIREKYFGHIRAEKPPMTYPLPQRARQPVFGFDDE